MKQISHKLWIGGFVTSIGAAGAVSPLSSADNSLQTADSGKAVMLLYKEKESGTEDYLVRMIVTEDYVRGDDAIDDGGYYLFDRKEKVLYSIQPENRRILVLTQAQFEDDISRDLEFEVDVEPDKAAPPIGGKQVYSYSLRANGEVCQAAAVVPGLLEAAVEAIAEMRSLLAGRQYRDLEKTPEEFRTPCFLANYVYASGTILDHGFPIQESNNDGLSRILIDYNSDFDLDAALLELPEGYSEFALP